MQYTSNVVLCVNTYVPSTKLTVPQFIWALIDLLFSVINISLCFLTRDSGHVFTDGVVGKAVKTTICSYQYSGGVNMV